MIRRPPRSTPLYSSAASDVYKRQVVLGNIELLYRRAGVTFLCTRVLSAGSLDIILPLDESVARVAFDIRLGGTDTPTTALGSTSSVITGFRIYYKTAKMISAVP